MTAHKSRAKVSRPAGTPKAEMREPKTGVSRLLLVGGDAEFPEGASPRSRTLLEALARVCSEPLDVVLLGQTFREEQLALFAADVRRSGFSGLILRLTSPEAQRWNDDTAGAISLTDRQRAVLPIRASFFRKNLTV